MCYMSFKRRKEERNLQNKNIYNLVKSWGWFIRILPSSFTTVESTEPSGSKQRSCCLTGLAVQGLGELVDRWGDLQPLVQDGALPLQTDVAGPLDEASQVPLGLDVLT